MYLGEPSVHGERKPKPVRGWMAQWTAGGTVEDGAQVQVGGGGPGWCAPRQAGVSGRSVLALSAIHHH